MDISGIHRTIVEGFVATHCTKLFVRRMTHHSLRLASQDSCLDLSVGEPLIAPPHCLNEIHMTRRYGFLGVLGVIGVFLELRDTQIRKSLADTNILF